MVTELLVFMAGCMVGGLLGVLAMCMFAISKEGSND